MVNLKKKVDGKMSAESRANPDGPHRALQPLNRLSGLIKSVAHPVLPQLPTTLHRTITIAR